jgi:uncharacterized protein YecE (DUF72 family)
MTSILDSLLLGTSSFSEADWVGAFYPEGTKPGDYLSHYASKFRTVEVDATYYAIPARRTVEGWAAKTPEDFIISAKFPRSIVHGGKGATPDPKIILKPEATYGQRDGFLEVMSLLGPRLGPLLIQFPYFSKAVFPNKDEFLARLDRFLTDLPANFRYAVEIRNRHWLTAEFADMLRQHNVALTLVDQAWMPMGDEVEKLFNPVTTDFAYIRLLGDREEIEAITTRWDKVVIDRTGRLDTWVEVIWRLLLSHIKTMVYVNNHYAGHAPETVRDLQARLALKMR